ncbi:leucyl/phenylalanyl-tRNA--protein transferase [Paraferrimonas sp. SM1919]|uniref:leucyl/phenylalanyl-tRNA--protein transferase n=1 Tax=Paraferrimonas sp. SM1919 TaxID=2662263 RepID=UPI0013D06686|nr:leucyl/phenylalanyl-tRNA--protein transferase [Paraferrimonas sp. SM1919]
MKLTLLDPYSDPHFPDVDWALTEPDGLLAVGGELTPQWLLNAYRCGIFPWFNEGEPVMWWSPSERAVLEVNQYQPSRSLLKSIRKNQWQFKVNHNFAAVIDGCSGLRADQLGSWITADMKQAYINLHQLGHAHSIEVYQDNALVGGLYGILVGGVFCGESMFHKVTDASKAAFYCLNNIAKQAGIELIDGQIENPHLMSLGFNVLKRREFINRLNLLHSKKIKLADYFE